MERQIIRIDPDRCDGCGLCIAGCPEGALQLIDGKARLVREDYCDGLGACLGTCPKDAISFETREAAAFDAAAVARHLATADHGTAGSDESSGSGGRSSDVGFRPATATSADACAAQLPLLDTSNVVVGSGGDQSNSQSGGEPAAQAGGVQPSGGCPGLKVLQWAGDSGPAAPTPIGSAIPVGPSDSAERSPSELRHWPVQLGLAPPNASFLQGADLLLTADCAPVAMGDFHRRLLAGRAVLLGCPKLDDRSRHVEKLAAIIAHSAPQRLTVVHMDVPCCLGLVQIAEQAIAMAGRQIDLHQVTVGRDGQVLRAVARGR